MKKINNSRILVSSSSFTSLQNPLLNKILKPIQSKSPISMSISISINSPLFHTYTNPLLKPIKIQSLKPHSFSIFNKPIVTFQTIISKNKKDPIFSVSASLQPIEQLPPKLQDIVRLFQGVQEPKAKYEQLLFYGRQLKPLDEQFKTSENKVQGCVSQVWVRSYLDQDKNVVFEADSDSLLTKGLAALLVQGLSKSPVQEIVKVTPDFVTLLGLQQSLTPSRNNGFLNMLELMKKKAFQLYVDAEKASNEPLEKKSVDGNPGLVLNGDGGNGSVVTSSEVITRDSNKGSRSGSVGLGSRGVRIKEILEKDLKPVELDVEDISYQHAGHAGVKGSDGETHFNVKVVSDEFEGKSLVKRHRLIYNLLQDELQNGLHALSIVAKTPAELGSR